MATKDDTQEIRKRLKELNVTVRPHEEATSPSKIQGSRPRLALLSPRITGQHVEARTRVVNTLNWSTEHASRSTERASRSAESASRSSDTSTQSPISQSAPTIHATSQNTRRINLSLDTAGTPLTPETILGPAAANTKPNPQQNLQLLPTEYATQTTVQHQQVTAPHQQVTAQNQQVTAQNQQPTIQQPTVQQATVQHQQTSVQHQQATVQHQQASVQHQQAPVQHQQAPVKQPTVQHQQATVQQQQATVQHQQATVQQQQATVQHQQTTVQQQQAPVQQLQAPVQQQQAPVQQATVQHQQTTVQQQQAPVQQQQAPVQQQQETIQQATVQHQQATVQHQQATVQQQQASVQHQQITVEQQQATVLQATVQHPRATVQQQHDASRNPFETLPMATQIQSHMFPPLSILPPIQISVDVTRRPTIQSTEPLSSIERNLRSPRFAMDRSPTRVIESSSEESRDGPSSHIIERYRDQRARESEFSQNLPRRRPLDEQERDDDPALSIAPPKIPRK